MTVSDTRREQSQLAGFWEWLLGSPAWPAFDRLLFLTFGIKIMMLIYVLTEINVADLLREGPRSVEELAEATGTHAPTLARALRTAAAMGVFTELPDGRFALTPEAEHMCSDGDGSLRDLVLFNAAPIMARPWMELGHTLRTGQAAFDHVFGVSAYEYFDEHPEAAELFERSMVQRSWLTVTTLLPQADLGRFTRLIDLGGGRGHFVGEALKRYPDLQVTLFERPTTLAHARSVLDGYGVTDKVTLMEGDFFESVPSGYDAYVLNAILDSWCDDDALRILERVRAAMADNPDARLLIMEKVVKPKPNEWDYSKLIDLDLLVLFGGRERSLADWRRLIDAAGFELVREPTPTGPPWKVLETRLR